MGTASSRSQYGAQWDVTAAVAVVKGAEAAGQLRIQLVTDARRKSRRRP